MQRRTDQVEESAIESFPASDPPAWTPVNGETVPGQRNPEDATRPASEPEARPQSDEVAALRDQLLRALAEQENIRRRGARERDETARFATANLARDVLPALDNLRRALESVAGDNADPMTQNLLSGVAATERALVSALAKHGISRISPAPGEPFDPNWHEAISVVDGSAHPPGTVAEVLQPGYRLHERLLRPAVVGVSGRESER